ncbi:hypothetical protein [uncultured Alistipes sp.]|uniref:hypothetical protein n=1 Tax=uncultured Alistipes sp. TaxID=538949 RepID=UPI0025ED548D|nr:hypothetical protein [uncultured Alistipes sp.]
MEPCAQKRTGKHNAELVEAVFRLMFEILWVAPYDRRRGNAAWREFDLTARRAVQLLASTDFAAASPEQFGTVLRTAELLVRCIGRFGQEHLFSPARYTEALALARRVADRVREAAACGAEA